MKILGILRPPSRLSSYRFGAPARADSTGCEDATFDQVYGSLSHSSLSALEKPPKENTLPAQPNLPETGRIHWAAWVGSTWLGIWNELPDRVGLAKAQQFWGHVAMTPGQPPKVGTSSVMKGTHAAPKWPGYSKTIHYEITGAGRIDYQFNPGIDLGSH